MTYASVLSLLAGIGLFLYGMNLMGDGLKNAAGAGLEHILEKLTNSRFKGLVLGTGVTAVMQSSAATSLMCLGFVNAGLMALASAVPVVMGSNIGSTVTAQILRLGDIGGGSFFLDLLKPSSFAPLLIAYGVVVLVFIKSRNKQMNNVATILLGLGLLFFGMSAMEGAISPLRDNEDFRKLFYIFTNPAVGILFGAVFTAVIQSSSASVGILQAISSTGSVTWQTAIPIIIGQNIGKCFTVWLGSLKTSKDSKRLALIHLLFNVIGALLFGGVFYVIQQIFAPAVFGETVTRGNIADFHTLFNLITALILLPCTNLLVKLSKKLIREDAQTEERHRLDQLDDLLLKNPAVALESTKQVAVKMGMAAKENFAIVCGLLYGIDEEKIDILEENERFLDKAESKVSDYLVKIGSASLAARGSLETNEILRSVSDFERIGDYCVNIYEMYQYNQENGIEFSDLCKQEIEVMNLAVSDILERAVSAFEKQDAKAASLVDALEEVVDTMKDLMNERHIERLKEGQCSVQAGISLIEYLTSVERISDHCSNVAVYTIRSLSNQAYFDTHVYRRSLQNEQTAAYRAAQRGFEARYLSPLEAFPVLMSARADETSGAAYDAPAEEFASEKAAPVEGQIALDQSLIEEIAAEKEGVQAAKQAGGDLLGKSPALLTGKRSISAAPGKEEKEQKKAKSKDKNKGRKEKEPVKERPKEKEKDKKKKK